MVRLSLSPESAALSALCAVPECVNLCILLHCIERLRKPVERRSLKAPKRAAGVPLVPPPSLTQHPVPCPCPLCRRPGPLCGVLQACVPFLAAVLLCAAAVTAVEFNDPCTASDGYVSVSLCRQQPPAFAAVSDACSLCFLWFLARQCVFAPSLCCTVPKPPHLLLTLGQTAAVKAAANERPRFLPVPFLCSVLCVYVCVCAFSVCVCTHVDTVPSNLWLQMRVFVCAFAYVKPFVVRVLLCVSPSVDWFIG